MKVAFVFALLIGTNAYAQALPGLAQPQAPSAQSTPTASQPESLSQSTPPTGPVHRTQTCDAFVSARMARLPVGRATLFWTRITSDGIMRDVRLYKTSGDDELDGAILRCAEGGQYAPVDVAGKPTEVTWVLGYFWSPRSSGFAPANPTGESAGRCDVRKYYPRSAIRKDIHGNTSASFHIGVDGTTRDGNITGSSGFAVLDRATLDCVRSFKYFPALHNGQPVVIDRAVGINWMLWP